MSEEGEMKQYSKHDGIFLAALQQFRTRCMIAGQKSF